MNPDKAGCVKGTIINGKKKVCAHQRMVDDHVNEQGAKTGRLVCRECGAIIRDPVKV